MRTGNAKNWLGIFFIVIGLLWLSDNFNMFYFGIPFHHLIFSWNTFMIIIGAIIISNNSRTFWGYIFVGVGVVGTLKHLTFIPFLSFLSFSDLWPLVIILLGIWMILNMNGKRHSDRKHFRDHSDNYFTKGGPANSEFWEERIDEKTREHFHQSFSNFGNSAGNNQPYDTDQIDEAAVFTGIKKYITSQNFMGGKISAIFGSVELNFTQAKLAPGEHVLEVTSIFGSVELRVPPEWKIVTNVTATFGGFEDKRYINSNIQMNPEATLVIKGSVVFAGGELSN
jgi:predicted membrane protein